MDVSFDNNCMKTLKGRPSLHLLLILLLITSSCVPDSLTKFKEEGATSDDASSSVGEVVDPPSGFEDDEGNEISADSIDIPSSVSYDSSKTHIFVTGDLSLMNVSGSNLVNYIQPSGNFGDYTIIESSGGDTLSNQYSEFISQEDKVFSVSDSTQNNFLDPISNPGFNFGTDLETTYASVFTLESKTGTIRLGDINAAPIRTFTAANANFNFYDPPNATAETITVTSMPKIAVMAPIPEKLTLEVDTGFNCTGTDIGTSVPSTPTIGDVYLDSGTCYFNYDGTNTNTVAFPFSGPVYIGFQLNSNTGFLADDSITSETFSTASGATGTITYKDESNSIFGTISSGEIYPGDVIDNQSPFSNTEGVIEKLKYYFQPDSNIVLKLINDTSVSPISHISYDNHTNIEVTPDLPSTLKLVKDVDSPLFGYIIDVSGGADHELQSAKEYSVTVSNNISKRTFTFDIGIVNPPEKLSYSQLTAFKVKNLIQSTSTFVVGQEVATVATPPLTEGAKGIIKKILDIDGNEKYLIVQVISGEFVKDSSIDNYKEFLDEEAVIQTEPVSLTHVMELNTTAAFTPTYIDQQPALCQEFIAAPSNEYAKAIVTGNPTDTGLSGYVFVNQVKDPDDTTANRDFIASNTNLADCDLGTSYTMLSMWAPVIEATFSDTASLVSGMDVLTTTNRASLSLSAIDSTNDTALLQSADGKPITLTLPAQFSSVRPYSLNADSITNYKSLTTFELQRGVESSLLATLPRGDSVVYSVEPELPPGLTLDPDTGRISGIPEVAAASKNFVVTAKNILGSASSSFNILIEDYFEVEIDIDNTPLFYGHKDGEGNIFNKCRIKKRDIISNPKSSASDIEDVIDIDCFFDIGEGDLYARDININANVGPGMCHTLEYVPFSYFKRRPNKTTDNQITYDGSVSDYIVQVVTNASPECLAAGTTSFSAGQGNGNVYGGGNVDVATYSTDGIYINGRPFSGSLDDICTGKYSEDINCDDGGYSLGLINFIYTEEVRDDTGTLITPSDCTNTVEVVKHTCEGNPRSCLDGPIVEEFGRSDVEKGFYAKLTEAYNGVNTTQSPTRPLERGGNTNVLVTNYLTETSCHDGNTDYYADGIKAHALSATYEDTPNNIVDPFMGANPFYTFNCLDQANDVQARINVHIRDWDTSFDLTNLDKAYIAGNWAMDNSLSDLFGNPINGFDDWDDLNRGTNYSACGPSTAPTVGTAYTVIPLTIDSATKSELSVKVTGGFPSEYFYPGMEIRIGTDDYQIKGYDDDEFFLTLPLLQGYTSGDTITGRYLYEFPAYKYRDEE